MIFWSSAVQVAAKMERMRTAETKLLEWAKQFGHRNPDEYEIRIIDTYIPKECILPPSTIATASSSKNGTLSTMLSWCSTTINSSSSNNSDESSSSESVSSSSSLKEEEENTNKDDKYVIHGVHVASKKKTTSATSSSPPPLILLHGYMNASAYFYRNIVGLSNYFDSIYSLDLLGWGLSSRPDLSSLVENSSSSSSSVNMVEQFFVESLEAWREQNNIESMILAGHSMGGYISVAYTEKYPERVHQLILLSPVGVPDGDSPEQVRKREQFRTQLGWKGRSVISVMKSIVFDYDYSFGSILRTIPTQKGFDMATNYVQRRLPAISTEEEQYDVANYLYSNNILPGSGEYCLNRILTPSVMAKQPLIHRIPKLQISNVTFLYGSSDWMDSMGGLQTQLVCEQQEQEIKQKGRTTKSNNITTTPKVQVHSVRRAGHLLMLDNWEEMNAGIIRAAGGTVPEGTPVPIQLTPPTITATTTTTTTRRRTKTTRIPSSSSSSRSNDSVPVSA